MSDGKLEVLKEWETELLRSVSVDHVEDEVRQLRISRTSWRTGSKTRSMVPVQGIASGLAVKPDKVSRFRLQEKYKDMFFVDKDPDEDNRYYLLVVD